jgi:hypothetical protein
MTKNRRNLDGIPSNQMSLFDIIKMNQSEKPSILEPGSFDISQRLKEMLSEGLRRCDFDRYEAAAQMSRLVGCEITKSQLDSWTAESKETYRFPAEYLPAFVRVTGYKEPLRVMVELVQCYILESEEALHAELGKINCQRRELAQREKEVREFLKQVEGGR